MLLEFVIVFVSLISIHISLYSYTRPFSDLKKKYISNRLRLKSPVEVDNILSAAVPAVSGHNIPETRIYHPRRNIILPRCFHYTHLKPISHKPV